MEKYRPSNGAEMEMKLNALHFRKGSKVEKCEWYEKDKDGSYCNLMDSDAGFCAGDISECECDTQRLAEEECNARRFKKWGR